VQDLLISRNASGSGVMCEFALHWASFSLSRPAGWVQIQTSARIMTSLQNSKYLLVLGLGLLLLFLFAARTQYRWINMASEAEKQQNRSALERSVNNLRNDFARLSEEELLSCFRMDPKVNSSPAIEAELRDLWARWRSTATHPEVLEAVEVGIMSPDGKVHYGQISQTGESLKEREWPTQLGLFRSVLEFRFRTLGREPLHFRPGDAFLLVNGKPTIIFPILAALDKRFPPEALTQPQSLDGTVELRAWGVLTLDANYLKQELLPKLVSENLGPHVGADYMATVVTGQPAQFIYQSAQADTAKLMTSADASSVIFRQRIQGPRAFANGGPPPASRVGSDRTAQPADLIEVPDEPFGASTSSADDWQLLVANRSGSLGTLFEQGRRWRQVLSFSILVLLGGSIVLLGIAARRARLLRQQQMLFVSSVSHELRTPLAVINSTSYNLASGKVTAPGRVQQYGEAIQNEVRRLSTHIEQILNIAGIESGKKIYDVQPVDVKVAIQNALREHEDYFVKEGWLVRREFAADLPAVLVDPVILESVVKTLVENAVKYAADGKWLQVEAQTSNHALKREVLIQVADKGPGIEGEDVPHIFQPFYRAKKVAASATPGTGLGLSLARRHLRSFKADITLESSSPQGTTFTVHLPATKSGARNGH
jgi:signal transduction histidine kinase